MKIKDLDRNQIYDLRGITHEQAEELLKWLIKKETRWVNNGILDITQCKYLVFYINRWCLSNEKEPTTHISTLFEPSYEEQLIEAVKRVEILKEKVKQLKEPKVGDVCKFWDDDEDGFVISKISEIRNDSDVISRVFPYGVYKTGNYHIQYYKNAKKLNQQEVIELLFNK